MAEAREIANQLEQSMDFGTPVTITEPYVTAFKHNVIVLPQFDTPPHRVELGPAEPQRQEEIVLATIDSVGNDKAELRFVGTCHRRNSRQDPGRG